MTSVPAASASPAPRVRRSQRPWPWPNPSNEVLNQVPERPAPVAESSDSPVRPPCPAPADFRAEVARYDQAAEHAIWDGPRYRMRYQGARPGGPR